jgi:hypothetical protein
MFRGRTRPHVGYEIRKILPAVAYRDAPTAVVLVAFCFGIGTATSHANPDFIFRHALATTRTAVDNVPVALLAAAGLCVTIPQVNAANFRGFSALTLAAPEGAGIPRARRRSAQYRQKSKLLSRKIDECAHRCAL